MVVIANFFIPCPRLCSRFTYKPVERCFYSPILQRRKQAKKCCHLLFSYWKKKIWKFCKWMSYSCYTSLNMAKMSGWVHACPVAQSCPTLCNPVHSSPPGSSVLGTSQARILESVAVSCSRRSSWPKDRTHISYVSCICRHVLFQSHHLGSPRCQVATYWIPKLIFEVKC